MTFITSSVPDAAELINAALRGVWVRVADDSGTRECEILSLGYSYGDAILNVRLPPDEEGEEHEIGIPLEYVKSIEVIEF